MPPAIPQTNWIVLSKAVNDAFIYGRFLPRTAETWQKEAKKVTTINLAKPFRQRIITELFPNLEVYNNKILIFSPGLLARVKEIEYKQKEAAAFIKSVNEELNRRVQMINYLKETVDPTAILRGIESLFNELGNKLLLNQKHLSELKEILETQEKLETKRASIPNVQKRAA